MINKLKQLDINISSPQENKFNLYIELFKEYNSKINLISNSDSAVLFEKHIFDSLAFNLFYKKYLNGETIKILDIGTGGGFPSVPLALYYDKFKITALDSINKKINFIKYAASELNLENITPVCIRAEELAPSYRSSYDAVVSRAMADLRTIIEYAVPYLKIGGYFIAYKSIKADEEILNAKNALKILNAEIIDKIEYTLPLEEKIERNLIVIKKVKETPSLYPRKNGLIKKKPL